MSLPLQVVPMFIDTHTHLDDDAFADDRAEVIANAVNAGVDYIINVGYSPSRWATTAALQDTSAHVSVMYGLHPQNAAEWSDAVETDLICYLGTQGTVAIGEIGLDYSRPSPNRDLQRAVFMSQLSLAAQWRLPIVIHQRQAENDLMTVLSDYPDLPPVVLHSFDGSERLARYALDRGWSFGIGGLATRPSSAALQDVLAGVPVESLLLETDSPYLIPGNSRQGRNSPANIPVIARLLAPLWQVSAAELGQATTRRAGQIFSLRPWPGADAAES